MYKVFIKNGSEESLVLDTCVLEEAELKRDTQEDLGYSVSIEQDTASGSSIIYRTEETNVSST